MSAEDLAAAVGSERDTVLEWHALGLLVSDGERFTLEDVERGRLILYVERRGISATDIAAACRSQGDLLAQFVALATGGAPRRGWPIDEVPAATGMDAVTLRRVWVASGLGDQDEAYEEDIDALRTVAAVLAAGMPEDAVVQLIRVYADALGRVAEAENRLFHYYVHERFRAEGLQGEELMAATNDVADPIIGLVEPTVLYFHRKAFQRASRDDFVLHLMEATTPPEQATGEMTATIVFADLSGFTPLTESMGDAAAAELVERFSELARDAASRHDGKVVKQIGDEFMLVFADPGDAVRFGLELDDAVTAEPQFLGLRMGAHHGSLLYREGDYIGTTVNMAARVAATATRHQFLVTEALRREARLADDAEVVPAGRHALKGISGEIELHEVRRGSRPDRVIDPVCGMVLDPTAVAARVRSHGVEVPFCSVECAERFRADPERYLAPSTPRGDADVDLGGGQ
jgi:adenylate cyclase